jgi:hypothetical protein
MAYTSTDLANAEAAIRAIMAGTRSVSLSMGDKSITYTAVTLPALQALRAEIAMEVGLAAGTFHPRTYAKQGGRGI